MKFAVQRRGILWVLVLILLRALLLRSEEIQKDASTTSDATSTTASSSSTASNNNSTYLSSIPQVSSLSELVRLQQEQDNHCPTDSCSQQRFLWLLWVDNDESVPECSVRKQYQRILEEVLHQRLGHLLLLLPNPRQVLPRMNLAKWKLESSRTDDNNSIITPALFTETLLRSEIVTQVPQLVFVLLDPKGTTAIVAPYMGQRESASDVYATMWRYYMNLCVLGQTTTTIEQDEDDDGDGSVLLLHEVAWNLAAPFPNASLFWSLVQDYAHVWFMEDDVRALQPYWIPKWFFPTVKHTSIYLLVQCRLSPTSNDESATSYRKLAQALSNHKHVWVLPPIVSEKADDSDTDIINIQAWKCDPVLFRRSNRMQDSCQLDRVFSNENANAEIVQYFRPTVLWMDRSVTAPIGMVPTNLVHAVLIINEQDQDEVSLSELSQSFHRVCETYRDDIVCWMLPSSERRILTTFGVDIWTPYDKAFSEALEDTTKTFQHSTPLPALLVTDQRRLSSLQKHDRNETFEAGFFPLRKYIRENVSPDTLETLFKEFWNGEWKYYENLLSTPEENTTTTSYGVNIVTRPWRSSVPHSLLFVTSASCGHCQRFHVIWKQFALSVKSLNWSPEWLSLYQWDVSKNTVLLEELLGSTVDEVPQVYYFFHPNDGSSYNSVPVRFDWNGKWRRTTSASGENQQRAVSSPLQLLEWLFYVGRFEDRFLAARLQDVRERHDV